MNLFSRKTTGLFRRCMSLRSKSKFSLPLDLLSRKFTKLASGDFKLLRFNDPTHGLSWSDIQRTASRLHNYRTVRRNWYIKCLQRSSVIPHSFFSSTRDGMILVPSFKIYHKTSRIVFDLDAVNRIPIDQLEWHLYRRYVNMSYRDDQDKYEPLIYEVDGGFNILTPDETASVMTLKNDGYAYPIGTNYFSRVDNGCVLVLGGRDIQIYRANLSIVETKGGGQYYYYDPLRSMICHVVDLTATRKVNNEYLLGKSPICTITFNEDLYSAVTIPPPASTLSAPAPPALSAPAPPQAPVVLADSHTVALEEAKRKKTERKRLSDEEDQREQLRIRTRKKNTDYGKDLVSIKQMMDKSIELLPESVNRLKHIIKDSTQPHIRGNAQKLLDKVERLNGQYLESIESIMARSTLQPDTVTRLNHIIEDSTQPHIRDKAQSLLQKLLNDIEYGRDLVQIEKMVQGNIDFHPYTVKRLNHIIEDSTQPHIREKAQSLLQQNDDRSRKTGASKEQIPQDRSN